MKLCIECNKNVVYHHKSYFCEDCLPKFYEGVKKEGQEQSEKIREAKKMLSLLSNAVLPQDVDIVKVHYRKTRALQFVIKQAERTQELEKQNKYYREIFQEILNSTMTIKSYKEHSYYAERLARKALEEVR